MDLLRRDGARGRNRTTDTMIFNHLLYQLSYPGMGIFKILRECQTCSVGDKARIKTVAAVGVKPEFIPFQVPRIRWPYQSPDSTGNAPFVQ